MPDICTSSVSPTGCGHRTITVTVDGVPVTLAGLHDAESTPLTAAETELFVRLAVRRLVNKGVSLASFLNRITHGEEATNVKQYSFFGPGGSITKTNIGAAYVNICPGLNGERQVVDLTGCTEFRLVMHVNLIGTGAFAARMVKDSDNAVLFESTNLGAAGERELDSDWQALPAPFVNAGLLYLRAQAKSATAADDPVFRSLTLGLR